MARLKESQSVVLPPPVQQPLSELTEKDQRLIKMETKLEELIRANSLRLLQQESQNKN